MTITPRRGDKISDLYQIERAIDTPAGSFARVFAAHDLKYDRKVAIKILRDRHLQLPEVEREQRYEAFNREAELLTQFENDSRVMNFFEVGYLWKSYVVYEAHSLGRDTIAFRDMRQEAIDKGWLPYMILEQYPTDNSLHQLVVHNPRGVCLPLIEAVDLSLQLADLLVKIHDQDIVYWDAKPAHAFWDGVQLVLIDWNVSYPLRDEYLDLLGGRKDEAKQKDLLILGRQFIYPAFIGLDFQSGQQPASKGMSTPKMVKETQAFYYRGEVPLYGHERHLDPPIREFLTRVVQSDEFETAVELRAALEEYAVELGWRFKGKEPHPKAAESLAHKRKALQHLRKAHDAISQAIEEIDNAHNACRGVDTEYLVDQIEALYNRSVLP